VAEVIDAFHAVIAKVDTDRIRRQSCQRGDGQRLHLPGAEIALAGTVADRRLDQHQPHTALAAALAGSVAGRSMRSIGQSQV